MESPYEILWSQISGPVSNHSSGLVISPYYYPMLSFFVYIIDRCYGVEIDSDLGHPKGRVYLKGRTSLVFDLWTWHTTYNTLGTEKVILSGHDETGQLQEWKVEGWQRWP